MKYMVGGGVFFCGGFLGLYGNREDRGVYKSIDGAHH